MVRWSSKPARTPADPSTTVSSSRTTRPATPCGGASPTRRWNPSHFAALKEDFFAHLKTKADLWVQDLFGGSQADHRVNVRVVTELAWHNLFIRTMLVRPVEG